MRRRIELEQELKAINPDEEFYLVYMPLVSAHTRRTEGFEVLLRWQSKKYGLVGPDEFVPLAEACGLFDMIDQWVCENALANYHKLKEQLGYDYRLSINLSSAQLDLNKIGKLLITLSAKWDVPANCVQLEMTETLNVEYTPNADNLLKTLSEHGFRIAIDDFGTGYTALLQLVEYPADMIKFDKTFVDKAMRRNNKKMLEPLIELCHSQGMQVTVEGVETESMAEHLAAIGADLLQGNVFGEACRMEELFFEAEPKKSSPNPR